jgi:hypothetical protein
MDETVARRIDYRVVRPDGTLVWTHVTSSAMPHEPSLRPDGWFDAGFDLWVAPPLLIQRRDGDGWTTIETSEV